MELVVGKKQTVYILLASLSAVDSKQDSDSSD